MILDVECELCNGAGELEIEGCDPCINVKGECDCPNQVCPECLGEGSVNAEDHSARCYTSEGCVC